MHPNNNILTTACILHHLNICFQGISLLCINITPLEFMVQHSPMSNESDFFRQRGSPHAVEDLRVWCPEVERNYLKGDGGFESSEINRIETFVVPRE